MSANNSSASVSTFDSSKAVAAQQAIDPSVYTDWTTSPLGHVVKQRLQGKVAIVTGASSGIGAVTARRLAAEGAKVVLFARREDKLKQLVSAIEKSGGAAAYVVGDVTSEADNKKLVQFTVKHFGGLHIAFNNAGIVRGAGQTPWDVSAETFNEQMSANVNSIFYAVKYEAPAISQSGGGVIVNNASMGAFGKGFAKYSVYSASKTWVVGYSQHAATDLIKIGVRINTVSPGITITDIGDHKLITQYGKHGSGIGRALKPEEIAASVAFLGSDEAQGITGTDLVIDGGALIADQAGSK